MSRLSMPTPVRKGLKAPSVHVGPARPGAPPSATGSSSSATSAATRASLAGARTMSASQLRTRAASAFGNQQHHDDSDEVSSNEGAWKEKARPPPLQRAATTSALGSTTATATPTPTLGSAGLGLSSTKTDNIRVVLRIRPARSGDPRDDHDESDDGENQGAASGSRRCLEVSSDGAGVTIAPGSLQEKRFAFDRVFDACSQEDIFQDTGLMAVENTLNGFNGCIFAYGQTGSGKTFTMLGGGDAGTAGQYDVHGLKVSPLRGLMPRIFDHLIRRLEDLVADDSNDLEYTLSCSYLEIYNEKIFDLLEVGPAAAQPKSLREDAFKKGVYVDQLRQIQIKSAAEAIEWLQVGSRNRRMASTDMNRESSRSHAVFTIRLLQTHHTERGVLITRRSNLHLVDLAGSEKQRQTKAAGQRLKEAAQINKSLSALGNVIMALVDVSNGLKRHVHYRDSKLTFLLKDSLGGNSITTIIGTISAEEKYFSETLSTLKFAQRAKFIKNKAVQNEDSDAIIPLLKQEIERLRQEIEEMKKASEADPGRGSSPYQHSHNPYSMGPEAGGRPRANKWEPALELMERLLKAAGAGAPDGAAIEQDIFVLEQRCQRLEMLLYRMICRFEEQKVMAFAGNRVQPAVQPPTIARTPSMLRRPKIQVVGKNDDDARSTTSTSNNNAELEQELNETSARNAELDAENNLLRHQLGEFLEWKTLVMDDRRRSSIGSSNSAPTVIPPTSAATDGVEMQALLEEQRERNEQLLETLNSYRSMFANLSDALDKKHDTEPRSPTASASTFAEDRSVSGASVADDDNESVTSEDHSADMDDEIFATDREMRRINNLALKFDRHIEKYQDRIQQLERSLVTAHDELETSTEAAKFAEFQLEQFRNSASRQSDFEAELNELRSKYRRATAKNKELEAELASKQEDLDEAIIKVQEAAVERRRMKTQFEEERSALQAAISSGGRGPETSVDVVPSKASDFDHRHGLDVEKKGPSEDDDTALIKALRRIRELEEQVQRQRSSSFASSLNGSFFEADLMFSEPQRLRTQSASVITGVSSNDDEIQSNFETHQQLQKVLHGVLADNTDLIKTVRELQSDKASREQEHFREVIRLRDECDSLRKRLDEMRELAMSSISTSKQAKQKAESDALIARLRAERKTLQTRLHQAQLQVRKLEVELSRSQSVNATRRSIASDFFCEM